MLEADRIKHKALRSFYATGNTKGINVDWVPKVERILQALDAMTHPEELYGVLGFDLHGLKGKRHGTWALKINKNYRVTFKWKDEGPYDVDMEDYHG
ncbi:MAG: type II toxin-antitoxin system RelE/ParE family toxin [Rhodomicrobiaceae bacterium]